jgi:hypothetical protein
MGVVYRARHLPSGELVALKTLQRLTPDALYRFKGEFRIVAGLAHPNLVTLRELVSDGRTWFFTMELLDGVDLRTHVGGAAATIQRASSADIVAYTPEALTRLREALGQLAAGLAALHHAGVLHRDVKPGNVPVTTTGRVVLLDFGLAGELNPQGLYHSSAGQVCGTVAYMAPEQAAGEVLSPAADWYSFGVMLYELLAGRLPFVGTVSEVLHDKQASDPRLPSRFRPGVPLDLERLCLDLLQRDPARRPSGAEVHRRLRVSAQPIHLASADRPVPRPQLIGREDHLRALENAFEAVQRGMPVFARINGPAGAGKSALAWCFIDRVTGNGAVTLAGRCYEHEFVPYKAFDGVVDALARYLNGLPYGEVMTLLPRDIESLRRLFPVLGDVPAVAAAPRGRGQGPDPRETRRRGLTALRELLTRLGDRRPLLIVIDDLQWGDADSLVLLNELLQPPDPPALMALVCYRSEDADSPILREVRQIAAAALGAEVIDVPVGPLTAGDARNLAQQLLGGDNVDQALAEVIAGEAGGNPFYVGELAEATRVGLAVSGGSSLDRLLWDRCQALPSNARQVLEVIVVAGRPVHQDIIQQSVGLGEELHAAQALLRARRLIRTTRSAGDDLITPYHDRVREAVLSHLPAEDRRVHHLRLAQAMEGQGAKDAEFLAIHFHGAGDGAAAARYYAVAGARAAAATAFDQAARLYELAAEVGQWPPGKAAELRAAEAEALANAGRGPTAAATYLVAAALVGDDEALEWRRRAAEQYLISGHIDLGLEIFREVVASVGITFPQTPLRAVCGTLFGQLCLWLRGVRFRRRLPGSVPPDELRRIDVCWSAATGLACSDFIRGAYFQTRGLLLALRAGEPTRAARALAFEGAYAAVAGPKADAKSLNLIEVASAEAAQSPDRYLSAFVTLARGIRHLLAGRFRAAVAPLAEAEQGFRRSCAGVTWEIDTARTWRLWCLCYLAEWAEVAAQWPLLLRDARERGDLYAEVTLGTYTMATVRTAADEPDRAWDQLRDVMARWSQRGFHVQHHNELIATVLIRLYQGNGSAAWRFIQDKEPCYHRAMLWRVQAIRIDFLQLRARSALAAAQGTTNRDVLLRSAHGDARRLERESAPWGQALGALMQACVHDARRGAGEPNLFAEAAARLEAADLGAFAAAARYRQGERTRGNEGNRLRDEAVSWLAGRGVRDPLRIIRSHVPTSR